MDNDDDGEYNEDGPGGVNIGINFPHLFKPFMPSGGSWAGSEPESHGLLEFLYKRPDVALVVTFGESNFCLNPPRSDRSGDVDLAKLRVPKDVAKEFNFDPDRTYTMDELKEIALKFVPPGMEVTESMIAEFLQLGAVVNPLPDDMNFYKELSQKYKDFLKKNKLDGKRLAPAADKDGSLELFAYYHLGLPSFAMDFWTLPEPEKEKKVESELTPEKLESMSKDDFLAIGEEKIGAFLKSVDAPSQFSAKMVMESVQNGKLTTQMIAEMLKENGSKKEDDADGDAREKALIAFSDKEGNGKGWVAWKPFHHTTLGNIEIGGAAPYAMTTPPEAMIEPLLTGQVPWVFELASRMPHIKIAKTLVTPLGGGLSRLEAWVGNEGFLPYPTAMGKRNLRITPVIATVDGAGVTLVGGKNRALVDSIDGNSTRKIEWIFRTDKPTAVQILVTTMNAGSDTRKIELGGIQ